MIVIVIMILIGLTESGAVNEMHGLEGAVIIPLVILASAGILYVGLIGVRRRLETGQTSARERPEPPSY